MHAPVCREPALMHHVRVEFPLVMHATWSIGAGKHVNRISHMIIFWEGRVVDT